MIAHLIQFIRDHYCSANSIALHAPVFEGNERQYVSDTIESTFVSSVGAYVGRFEQAIKQRTGADGAVATVNGTAALHLALKMAGVQEGDLVITQALTFVATCNAIRYCGADPVFLDVDRLTLGLCPEAVSHWLHLHAAIDDRGVCRRRADGRAIRAIVPMHTFGHPARVDALEGLCATWRIELVEDAAESLGSLYRGKSLGTFGSLAALSFNGNKIVTTGGGGMLLCSRAFEDRARHISSTAKRPDPFEYDHDEVGHNYRMPNLNAALGLAQLEQLDAFIAEKRNLAHRYQSIFKGSSLQFFQEPVHATSNYWLNAVLCEDGQSRQQILLELSDAGIQARPVWRPMHKLPMFAACERDDLIWTQWLADRLLNLPSGVRSSKLCGEVAG